MSRRAVPSGPPQLRPVFKRACLVRRSAIAALCSCAVRSLLARRLTDALMHKPGCPNVCFTTPSTWYCYLVTWVGINADFDLVLMSNWAVSFREMQDILCWTAARKLSPLLTLIEDNCWKLAKHSQWWKSIVWTTGIYAA